NPCDEGAGRQTAHYRESEGAAELPAMLVTAGDSAADPIPVVMQTPRGLVAAPCVTGRPIGTGEAHRTVLPYPAPGPMRRARLAPCPDVTARPDRPAPAARFQPGPCVNWCFRGHAPANLSYQAYLGRACTDSNARRCSTPT